MFFPHPYLADGDGFLAMCDDISVERLLLAYQFGIFPWYIEGQPMWWFYTYPRCVLLPSQVKISKSMRSYFNQNKFTVTFDTHFDTIISNCQQVSRKGQSGTWITEDLKVSFNKLHKLGYAHSVEVWENDKLVGGLYGMALGKIFFGESMFAKKSNASKFALIYLCHILEEKGFRLIDCQQVTNHILRLGATTYSKEEFYTCLQENLKERNNLERWTINIPNKKTIG